LLFLGGEDTLVRRYSKRAAVIRLPLMNLQFQESGAKADLLTPLRQQAIFF
jgi:hypothetical protein